MIYHGNLFDTLPTLDADSVDACVTDPPYGIGVMGKEWDTFKLETIDKLRKRAEEINPNKFPDTHSLRGRNRRSYATPSAIGYDKSLEGQRIFQAWTERWASEIYRVLKPGAHLLVCGAPRTFHRMASGIEDAGFEVRDCLSWLYGQGFPKSLNVAKAMEAAGGTPDDVARWQGFGTALKPSWEPIVVARKPLIDTLAVNVGIYGTGALNVEGCKIGSEERHNVSAYGGNKIYGELKGSETDGRDTIGRWPPNVLLDEEAASQLDAQTGQLKASRFMYVAKPAAGERDEGCYDLVPRQATELTGRKEGSAGLKHARAGTARKATNHHPTVKPIALMQWLVTLVTPPDGIVIDPFMGSGTTGMAARYADRRFVGIEKEADYVEIARRRIGEANGVFYGEETVMIVGKNVEMFDNADGASE